MDADDDRMLIRMLILMLIRMRAEAADRPAARINYAGLLCVNRQRTG